MTELAAIYDLVGRAGSYAMLRFSAATDDPATGALLQAAQERGAADRDRAAVLRPRVAGAARRDAPRSCSRARAWSSFGHHLRVSRRFAPYRLSEPEERVHHRAARDRPQRLVAAVRRAGRRDHGPARRRDDPARAGDVEAVRPGSRRAPRRRRGDHRGAPARPAHARVRVQHAARGEGDRGPHARPPALAGRAQHGQRGVRRVGRGARRGRARPLRDRAPLVPAEGAHARRRHGWPTTTATPASPTPTR